MSTPRLPQPIRKGQRLGNKIPVDLVNAGREALKSRQRDTPMMEKGRRNRGGGGDGGSSLPVFVYSDIIGGTRDTDGAFTPGSVVKYLPAIIDEAKFAPDLDAEFGEGKVWTQASLSMDETGCCGDGPGPVPTGILIDTGLGADGNDRIYDGDANSGAVVVSGTGVAIDATLTGEIDDGVNTPITLTITNNGDGTWTADSESLTTLDKGPVKVTVSDGATTDSVTIVYAGDDDGTERAYFDGRAPRPDLVAASDLGASDTDNVTSDDTPTFSLDFGGVDGVPTGEGPHALVYGNGEPLITSGSVLDFQDDLTIEKTVGSAMAEGAWNIQLINKLTVSSVDYYGPPSLRLRMRIDADATEETEPAKRYGRLGWMTTALGVNWVTVDKCRFELTEAEITKLDA